MASHADPAGISIDDGRRLPLRALGVGPGDRVGVLDWNDRRFFELYYAIAGIGAVMVLLNQRLCPDDLGYVIRYSEPCFSP